MIEIGGSGVFSVILGKFRELKISIFYSQVTSATKQRILFIFIHYLLSLSSFDFLLRLLVCDTVVTYSDLIMVEKTSNYFWDSQKVETFICSTKWWGVI